MTYTAKPSSRYPAIVKEFKACPKPERGWTGTADIYGIEIGTFPLATYGTMLADKVYIGFLSSHDRADRSKGLTIEEKYPATRLFLSRHEVENLVLGLLSALEEMPR
jgi:hypothetical protein